MSKQRRGACVFCERDHNLTKQHILPDRLKKILPRTSTSHLQSLVVMHHTTGASTIRPKLLEHQGHMGTRKLRKVCGPCNSGWIRLGEEAAFDLISAWILGEPVDLDADQQSRVSLIASTIFTMVDLDDLDTSAVIQADRSSIFDTKAPPPTWHIFVGRIDASDWEFRFRHHGSKILGDPPGHVHISTVGIGKFLLHLVDTDGPWSRSPDGYAQEMGLARLNSGHLIRVTNLPQLKGFEVDRIADALNNDFTVAMRQFLSMVRSRKPGQP